ncbi:HET-domain-containing protein [Penicillium malachiteum]|nr:HET-domain-containing protein [Penicillium malachiteum]
MFMYYEEAAPRGIWLLFDQSRWFGRGFTLQELIASSEIIFLSNYWREIGTKISLRKALSQITRIDEDILMNQKSLESVSVARRMSWAAHRQTTRPKDIAYCLMGIFFVDMAMLYREGSKKAYLCLQEEIMKKSDDQSIFA